MDILFWVEKLRFKWNHFWSKARVSDHFDCGMGWTPDCLEAMDYLYQLESFGLKKGYLKQRSVKKKE